MMITVPEIIHMKKLTFLFILSTLFLSGCTTQISQTDQTISDNESAKIVIYRDAQLWLAGFSAPIYVNQLYIGKVGNGGTLHWAVKPGPVTLSTATGVAALKFQHYNPTLSFNAVKNKTYTFKVVTPVQVNLVCPGFGLQLMNP